MKNKNNNQLLMTLMKGRTFIVLIVLVIFFSIASRSFLSVATLTMVAKHVALYGILALGMTFVIITGGIDLSVGSVVGLTGMLAGGMIQEGITIGRKTAYFSVPMIILFMLLFGCLVGVINGLVVTKLGVAPFIATLGTMYICRGFANLRSGGTTFSNIKGYEGLGNVGMKVLGSNIAGIPAGVYVFAVLAVIAAVLLKKMPIGWYILAVGGNEKSARLSGIKADKVKIFVYAISGFCAAWVGLINTAQLSAAHPASGDGWEMNAIAATVLGGTSMAGGSGTIIGTIVGAFVIGVINDGMTMCGVSEFWQKVIRGFVIILAVVIDQTQRNLQAKMALQEHPEFQMILHSDQGSVYASKAFNDLLSMYVTRSMSRAGTPTDNAAMESINGWIKAELFMDFHVTGEKPVEQEIDEYIIFFNEQRPAYSLNYLTPKQYREAHAA